MKNLPRANVDNLGQVQQRRHPGGNVHIVVKDRLLHDATRPALDRVGTGVALTGEDFGHDCVVGINGLYSMMIKELANSESTLSLSSLLPIANK